MTDKTTLAGMRVILITGMSGSGKSVALRALEDLGYYCVDNLPPALFEPLVSVAQAQHTMRLAVAIDVRSAQDLHSVPQHLRNLREQGLAADSVFLDASTEILLRRFSETRRNHPLSQKREIESDAMRRDGLLDAIERERELLGMLHELSHVVDTSTIRAAQLQTYIKSFAGSAADQMTLVFESFAYKRGVPGDADYIFDVRMLPNPHYEPALKALTGLDTAVAEFLQRDANVRTMQAQITSFLDHWLVHMAENHRSYVTVAIGCTGGQHRSVYLVEQLAHYFEKRWTTLKRHRELDAQSI